MWEMDLTGRRSFEDPSSWDSSKCLRWHLLSLTVQSLKGIWGVCTHAVDGPVRDSRECTK